MFAKSCFELTCFGFHFAYLIINRCRYFFKLIISMRIVTLASFLAQASLIMNAKSWLNILFLCWKLVFIQYLFMRSYRVLRCNWVERIFLIVKIGCVRKWSSHDILKLGMLIFQTSLLKLVVFILGDHVRKSQIHNSQSFLYFKLFCIRI